MDQLMETLFQLHLCTDMLCQQFIIPKDANNPYNMHIYRLKHKLMYRPIEIEHQFEDKIQFKIAFNNTILEPFKYRLH